VTEIADTRSGAALTILDRANAETHISTTANLVRRHRRLLDADHRDRRVPSDRAGRQVRRRNPRDPRRNPRGLHRIHRDVPSRLVGRRVCRPDLPDRESPAGPENLRENPRARRELG
jgi:hypothetical protein